MFITAFFSAVAFVLVATPLGGYLLGRKTRAEAEDKEVALMQTKGGLPGIAHDFR